MSLLKRISAMFGFGHHPPAPAPRTEDAIRYLQDISKRADVVNSKLQTYVSAPDPFAAFMSDATQAYNDRTLAEGVADDAHARR